MKNTLKNFSVILILTISFIACDKDYNTIGSDILSDQGFTTNSIKFPTVAYTKKLNPVRSSNLNSSLLGVYKDPVYGLTTAHIVTQATPTSFNPDFGVEPILDSVFINIPYFSSRTGEVDDNGNALYEIDSLYGNQEFKISIYQNNYFLRDLDPDTNLEEAQLYYSNANSTIDFNSHTGQLFYENNNFLPSNEQIILTEINEESEESEETSRLQPGLRADLAFSDILKDYWSQLFLENQDDPAFSNANQFRNFFRGLYIKAEAVNDDGSMLMLNFANSGANFTLYYHTITTTTDEDGIVTEEINNFEYVVNLTGNKVNIIDNNFNFPITDGNPIDGDDNLYLKGMEGSMAVINLFDGLIDDNGVEVNAFEYFIDKFKNEEDASARKLINEANLTFYVDQNMVQGQEPDRVILYDLKNNVPVVDYFFDLTNSNFPSNSKLSYSRILERDEDDNGVKYKLRLTEHINNILLRDSTNVALGLVIAANVNTIDELELLDGEDEVVNAVPLCQFLSPRGTVLHGSTGVVPEDKRVNFEIFFSEPNEIPND